MKPDEMKDILKIIRDESEAYENDYLDKAEVQDTLNYCLALLDRAGDVEGIIKIIKDYIMGDQVYERIFIHSEDKKRLAESISAYLLKKI